MSVKLRITIFCIFCAVTSLFAQPADELATYKTKYPNEYIVDLNYTKRVVIDIVKDSLSIYSDNSHSRYFIDELAAKSRGDQVNFSGFTTIENLEAYTLVPKGKKYKKVKTKEFLTKDVLDNAIFHDDNKQITFEYPQLKEGCKTNLEHRIITKSPYMVGSFFFTTYVPLEKALLEVKVNKNVEIDFRLFNTDTFNIKYTLREEKGYNIYTWEAKDIPAFDSEGRTPNARYMIPHMIFYIKNYTINNDKKMVLENLSYLHKWYHSLLGKMSVSNDEELKSIVDSITSGLTTEEEKVKTIFYWVQDNIKYVAFEDGMNGFIPEEASKVCRNKFGDCKGNASVIVEMLKIAGIKGYFTWIGSRDVPYKYTELPTVYTDNHMIAAYKKGDEFIFLDATGTNLPYGMPTSFIQGKEALISLGKDDFVVKEVPTMKNSAFTDSLVLEIKGSEVHGKGEIRMEGYYKVNYTNTLTGLPDKELKERVKSICQKGNNKFELEDFEIFNLGERDKPLLILYSFVLKDYLNVNGDESYINLNLDKIFSSRKIEKDRKHPIEESYERRISTNTVLVLPENASVSYLPENSSYSNEKFGYNTKYSKEDGVVVYNQDFETKYLMLEKSSFEDWNKMIKKLKNSYNESILIKK